jgi:hypothetical protein
MRERDEQGNIHLTMAEGAVLFWGQLHKWRVDITIDQHGRIHEVDLSRATGYPFASKDELIEFIEAMRPHLELSFWSIQQKKH